MGEGTEIPELISTELWQVIRGVDVILVCLPTLAYTDIAKSLIMIGANDIPVILNPGHTGGALEFSEVYKRAGIIPPPIAEFSTLTYIARKPEPDIVSTTGKARHVWLASLPGGDTAAEAAMIIYPFAEKASDVLATDLANVNMVLHAPGCILGAAWIESTGGDFTFYVEGLPDGVGQVIAALDDERLVVAKAFGHNLPNLFEEMQSIGSIEQTANPVDGLSIAIRSGDANSRIKAPDSLNHRYYKEDFWYGIKPFIAFAEIAGIEVPVAKSLMTIAENLVGDLISGEGRSANIMGISGINKENLLELVRGT